MIPHPSSKREVLQAVDGDDGRYFVAELPTGYLTLSRRRQYFRGYCFFSCKVVARELHDLPVDLRTQHLLEMTVITEAVQRAFHPRKMNVAYFGNALAQIYWNIIPRYGTDPLPKDAI
ncbi:HIT family protein [Bradyrhizobium algeriense]|uniref:HIT family protein n=1 Tax=Bradyrhizobium algeriense TaxID=634784 RepID=UPI000D343BCF|nr:HIT family protein [Bradyrhizobium algeriense]